MPCVNTISGPLVIRYSGSDTGARPIPDNIPYWASPDIWLEHPSDNSINEATTRVGVPTSLKVLIHNISANPIQNVSVEAFVCHFTSGVSPATAIVGTGKFTGFVGSIGTGANNGAVVTCNQIWTPTTAQLDDQNNHGGHVCMFANCFSDTDGQSVDTMALDPVTHSLPFRCDSHLAQRNIRIVAASKGQGGAGLKRIQIAVILANASRENSIIVSPKIQRIVGRNAITKNERWMLQTSPFIKTIQVAGRKRFVLADQGEVMFSNRAAARKATLLPEDVSLLRASRFRRFDYDFDAIGIGAGRDLRIPLEPLEAKPIMVNIALNTNEAIGSTHTFDITHTTPDGTVIGGVRILTVIVP